MNKQVYYNGAILTMENPSYVEAIYVNNGIIEKVGTAREMLKYKKSDTQMIDLEGKTLMPAFIDAYGHLLTFAKSLKAIQGDLEGNEDAKWHRAEKEMSKWICAAQNIYLSQGITTAQEGLVGMLEWADLRFMADKKLLNIDVIGYVDLKQNYSLLHKYHKYTKHFIHRLKLGGYKIFLDGYLYNQTAWQSTPYLQPKETVCACSFYSDEDLKQLIEEALADESQLIIHCNGDSAADQLIRTFYSLLEHTVDTRPVLIHAEALRPDQLDRLKRIGAIPCYAISNIYYYGEYYLTHLGASVASQVSPLKTTTEKKCHYTFHQSASPNMPNILHAIWCAVNRLTAAGNRLGETECITPLEALKAVTLQAAYQCFEEQRKGSLREGKVADLIILDKNPLMVDVDQIKEIKVLQTIKEGKIVYTHPDYTKKTNGI